MINSLHLENFRVFDEVSLSFQTDKIIFEGGNGQGKTSLIESIFYAANLRSFRTMKTQEMRKMGSPFFRLRLQTENNRGRKTLLGIDCGENKLLTVDHIPVSKASDFTGRIHAAAFLPDDPFIISGSSVIRRRFFDMFIAMLDREYLTALQNYSSALRSRNFLLKSRNPDVNIIQSYNTVLASCGETIVRIRMQYVKLISDRAAGIIREIRPELGHFSIKMKYLSDTENRDSFCRRLEYDYKRDLIRGFTGTGPHLDDFEFFANDKSLKTYGSRGQLRVSSFALKMAQFRIMTEVRGTGNISAETVVLVDDVLGDLDKKAKEAFFREVDGKGQIFYTFTEKPREMPLEGAETVHIQDGTARME